MNEAKVISLKEKELLNLQELQEFLGVGRNTALTLLHTGPFCVRIGKRVFANRELLSEWLKAKSGMYSCVENVL